MHRPTWPLCKPCLHRTPAASGCHGDAAVARGSQFRHATAGAHSEGPLTCPAPFLRLNADASNLSTGRRSIGSSGTETPLLPRSLTIQASGRTATRAASGNSAKGTAAGSATSPIKGLLDSAVPPVTRVTLEAVRGYLGLLQVLDNRDHTIIGRFDELQASLRILAPDHDFSWVTKPRGLPLRQRLPMGKRTFPVPSSRLLFEWRLELAAASSALSPKRRHCKLRGG